jgi:hypothetical protein
VIAPAVALAVLSATDAGTPVPWERNLVLHALQVEAPPKALSAPGKPKVALELNSGELKPGELRRRTGVSPAGGRIAMASLDYPSYREPPVDKHRAASFLIDFQEASMRSAHDLASAELGGKPNALALTAFADRYIKTKGMRRAFDVASRVAALKEGDCSEHAVFLAGLARSFELPSRVILGIVLIEHEGVVRAFGHAWTEIHEGGQWRLADAALATPPPGVVLKHIPVGSIEDEGPGFMSSVVSDGAVHMIRRVVVER